MSLLDNFGTPTPEILAKRKAELEAIEKNINAIAQIGSDCLGDAKFRKYRSEYEKLQEQLIDFMMVYANSDPVQDGFFTRTCLGKLGVLKVLINGVEKDSKRKVK